jgi:hypothetical protein
VVRGPQHETTIPEWRVIAHDGELRIIDQDGREPLRLADESECICNLFLAAAAPRLRASLAAALHRLEYVQQQWGNGEWATSPILAAGHAAMIDARPRPEEVEQLKQRDRQMDMFRTAIG